MKTNDEMHPLTPGELHRANGSPDDFMAVYEAAERERDKERRRRTRAERHRRAVRRRLSILVLVILSIILCAIVAARATITPAERTTEAPKITAESPDITAAQATPKATVTPDAESEDPQEPETAEAAMLAQGYLSDAVPLSYDLQDTMRTACAEYDCPYPLALAVADIESNFDMDAVGAAGEVGIMQLNPGPGGSYHAELEAATGADPTTPDGNIICGVYLLGKYMDKYGDPAKAVMAYNMGEGGAKSAWNAGITSNTYTAGILTSMEDWECTVNAWGGV